MIDYPRFAHPEHPELFCQPILVSKPTNGAKPIVTIHGHYPRPIHCFHADTEFLSQIGDEFPAWRAYDAVITLGAKIAQYGDGVLSFVRPTASVKRPSDGALVAHKRKTFEIAVTPGHRMFSLRRTTGNVFLPHTDTAADWLEGYTAHRRIPQAGHLQDADRSRSLSPVEAELIAFYVADGHQPKARKRVQFHFRKIRKVERVKHLLDTLGIEYTHAEYAGDHVINFDPPNWVNDCYTDGGEKRYPSLIWNMSSEAYFAFRRGTLISDGNLEKKDINSSSKTAAEQIQIVAALNGEAMNIRYYDGRIYKQSYQDTPYVSFRNDLNTFEEIPYNGDVVCFSVPSTYLFVRYKGFAFVSGNCEILTHKKFGRNARSSRAVPVRKMLEEVRTTPYVPWHWGANQRGMQAGEECSELLPFHVPGVSSTYKPTREEGWLLARDYAADMAEAYMDAGYHKQNPNRLLEPFSWMHTLITSTSWANFKWLRDHKDAEPHFQDFARLVVQALDWIKKEGAFHLLEPGQWHLPYIRDSDRHEWIYGDGLAAQEIMDSLAVDGHEILRRISAARSARISYEPFDGDGSPERELERFDLLVGSDRIHASPMEHQATPDGKPSYGHGIDPEGRPEWLNPHLGGNLGPGWIQFRKTIVGEYIEDEDWL